MPLKKSELYSSNWASCDELRSLRIGDVDKKTGKVTIWPGLEGKAKGRKDAPSMWGNPLSASYGAI